MRNRPTASLTLPLLLLLVVAAAGAARAASPRGNHLRPRPARRLGASHCVAGDLPCAASGGVWHDNKPARRLGATHCVAGDLPCACAASGGVWHDNKPPLEPVCTIYVSHQGRQRLFNVYLPRGYDMHKPYPAWIHLHGVYWDTMDNITERVGRPVLATEATAIWDSLAVGSYRDTAMVVYPQALSPSGDGSKRTFWNIPFWHCSVGVCADPAVDDVGFIEKVVLTLPSKLAVDRRRIYMSGTSAGGMMLHHLLCSSSVVGRHVAAAVDLIGGVGAGVRGSCRPGGRVPPLRIVHGETDSVLPFDKGAEVDGSPFMSTRDAAAMWKDLRGCAGDPEKASFADTTATSCTSLCAKPGSLELCKMAGIGHQLDIPYQGYPFTVAWQWFAQH